MPPACLPTVEQLIADRAPLAAVLQKAVLARGPSAKQYKPLCPCCGFTRQELGSMWRAQAAVHVPAPADWGFGDSPFVRAILRLPSAEHVRKYRSTQGDSSCVYLDSSLSAAQRASRVKSFQHGGGAALGHRMLLRTGFGSPSGRRVSDLGDGGLLREILAFARDHRVLVCDGRTGDVGYNLQNSTHLLCPSLPGSVDEVLQLAGRVSRLGSSSAEPVSLLCLPRQRTPDEVLFRHIRASLAVARPASSPGAGRCEARGKLPEPSVLAKT